MPLELKDLATQKALMVPEEGITFGREGGDANVQLRDTGVSKRHARVFGENGAWFLEDLGSSNGTWLQKERIKDATELLPGDVFQMSQAKYEVVQVMADGEGAEPTAMARDEDGGDGEVEQPSQEEPLADENEPTPKPMPAAAKGAPSKKMPAAPVPKENSVSKGKMLAAPPPPSKKMEAAKAPADAKGAAAAPTDPGEGAPKKKGGSVFAFISGAGLLILPTALGMTGAMIQKAMRSGSSSSGSVDSQVADAQAQAEAAQKQADAQIAAAEKQADAAEKQADKAVAAAEKGAAPPPAADEKKGTPPPAPAPTPAPAPAPAPTPAAAGKPPEKHADTAPAVATGAGYGVWHSKWDAIEKRITDDPTVLNKDPSVLGLYKQLEEDIYETETKFAKGKKPSEKRVSDHLRDAELYEKTEKTVGELHQKLFGK